MKRFRWAMAFAMAVSATAFAEDSKQANQSKIKLENVKENKNKISEDIDEEITNAKLRAESGSKSRWSASFTGSYYGASIEKPLDKDRPNPSREPLPPQVRMDGTIGARYRFNKRNSLAFGTGYTIQRPLQEAKRGNLSDPYASFNNASKIGPVQNIAQAVIGIPTSADALTVGDIINFALVDTMMYDFNGSRLSVGLATELDYNFYRDNKNDIVSSPTMQARPAGSYQDDYGFAIYPMVEYAFSDKVQFRTVFRPWNFAHNVLDAGWTLVKRPWTQSVGIGLAVTRDIYLYPNFQFAWETWRGDDFNFFRKNTRSTSTVGLAATVNLF